MRHTRRTIGMRGALMGLAACLGLALAWAAPAAAEPADLIALSDEELDRVSAGEFQLSLEDFDVAISNNEAGFFTMDIASQAFGGAEGLFTTLQAVNSAVDLTVVVNIFLNNPQAL